MARGRAVTSRTRRSSAPRAEPLIDIVVNGALTFVEKEAPENLTLRGVREYVGGGFSPSAPLHHFGSMTGLYGAVAARGFEMLTGRLRSEREQSRDGQDALHAVVLAYGHFALQRPNLYRVMHWPAVWARLAAMGSKVSDVRTIAAESVWLRKAEAARDHAFSEIAMAAQLGQAAGAVAANYGARDVARLMTAVVDGYLFQTLFEHVEAPRRTLRADLDRCLRMVIDGVGRSTG
jgi:AcrR family transcriptional regulator